MSTIHQSPVLENSALNLPSVPEEFLVLTYLTEDERGPTSKSQEALAPFPLAACDIVKLPIKDVIWLSKGENVKEVIEVSFDVNKIEFDFLPGDTVGIIPVNSPAEVESILKCLGILKSAKQPFKIHLKMETKKKNATTPSFIPVITNAQQVLENFLEIRAPMKKLFVRALVDYTTEPKEKRRLEELCSRQGAKEFAEFVTEARATLLDILECFPSCRPPLSRLIEFLPRLAARPYSISSSPLIGSEFRIALSLTTFPAAFGSQERQGVCSGWLFRTAEHISKQRSLKTQSLSLTQQLENISLQDTKECKQVNLFRRKSTDFHLPAEESVPLIFVGPGTGIAPFIGFLQHRHCLLKSNPSRQFGETWLFFGCRYEERDFLYRDAIDGFLESGALTKLFVSYSRNTHSEAKYVQDNIRLNGKAFVDRLLDEHAVVYVCGDAAGMAKDVLHAIVSVVQMEKGTTEDEAMRQVTDLKTAGRYLQDVWT